MGGAPIFGEPDPYFTPQTPNHKVLKRFEKFLNLRERIVMFHQNHLESLESASFC